MTDEALIDHIEHVNQKLRIRFSGLKQWLKKENNLLIL